MFAPPARAPAPATARQKAPAQAQAAKTAEPSRKPSGGGRPHAPDFARIPIFPPPPPAALPGALQRKLIVGETDDPLEHEADRVADQVLRAAVPAPPSITPAPPTLARKCACGTCAACEEERLQRKAADASARTAAAPAGVGAVLASAGRPLDADARAYFEPRFGEDFSGVRIHAYPAAQASARAVDAKAYTVGHDIVFGAGMFQPATDAGRRLLAHELAHVVQQDRGRAPAGIQRKAQTFTVTPEYAPMSGGEVLIRMAMASRKVGREAAIRLIADDDYGCGEHPACLHGVTDTTPIQFTIGRGDPEPKPQPKPKPDAKAKPEPKTEAPPPAAPEPEALNVEEPAPAVPLPADVTSALDNQQVKRFITLGERDAFLHLSQGQPNPDDYVAVYYIRDAVLRLNDKELACYRSFAAEKSLGDWQDLAQSLRDFNEVKAELCQSDYVDPHPLDRVRDAELYYAETTRRQALEAAYNKRFSNGRGASFLPQTQSSDNFPVIAQMQGEIAAAGKAEEKALHGAGFADVGAFETAANDFRLYFRGFALTRAEKMLFESGQVLSDAVSRYQLKGDTVPKDCEELYDKLYRTYNGPTVDQLKDAHPILRDPAALHAVSLAHNVYEFSWRLTLFAQEKLRDLGFIQSHLRIEPDVVFKFEGVVKATFAELGLAEDPILAWIIREQKGKPGSSLAEKLLHIGLELLLFAASFISLPVGLTIGVVRAVGRTASEGDAYAEGMREYNEGLRAEAPSAVPMIMAPIEELGPYALHGAFSWFKGLRGAAQAEKLVGAGAATEREAAQGATAAPKASPAGGGGEPDPLTFPRPVDVTGGKAFPPPASGKAALGEATAAETKTPAAAPDVAPKPEAPPAGAGGEPDPLTFPRPVDVTHGAAFPPAADVEAAMHQSVTDLQQATGRLKEAQEAFTAAEDAAKRVRPTVAAVLKKGGKPTAAQLEVLARKEAASAERAAAKADVDAAEKALRDLEPKSAGGIDYGKAGLEQELKYAGEISTGEAKFELTNPNTPVIDGAKVGKPEVHSVKSVFPAEGATAAVEAANRGSGDPLFKLVRAQMDKSFMDRLSDKWSRLARRWNTTMRAAHAGHFGYELPKNPDEIEFVLEIRVVSGKAPTAQARKLLEDTVEAWLEGNSRTPEKFTWKIDYIGD